MADDRGVGAGELSWGDPVSRMPGAQTAVGRSVVATTRRAHPPRVRSRPHQGCGCYHSEGAPSSTAVATAPNIMKNSGFTESAHMGTVNEKGALPLLGGDLLSPRDRELERAPHDPLTARRCRRALNVYLASSRCH